MASDRSKAPYASSDDVAQVRRLFDALVRRAGDPESVELEVLSVSERALYVLRAAADEVARGGFEQLYFFLPHLAAEATGAAQLVKARAFARLFERANAIAFEEGPRKRAQSEFKRMMKAVGGTDAAGELGRLDDEFDALMANPSTSLDAYLAAFAEDRAFEFRAE
jgi:hypothetical protein